MSSLPTLASFLVPVWAPDVVASLSAVICHVCSPTAFNCSSVAARPFVAKSAAVTVVLDKPVISFVVPPVTVTVPVLIVPSAPLITTALAPPVVILLAIPSIPTEPICPLPAVIVLVFVPSVIVLDVAIDVFTLPLPSSITLLSTVVLLDLTPSTNVFSSTVDVFVLVPSLIT